MLRLVAQKTENSSVPGLLILGIYSGVFCVHEQGAEATQSLWKTASTFIHFPTHPRAHAEEKSCVTLARPDLASAFPLQRPRIPWVLTFERRRKRSRECGVGNKPDSEHPGCDVILGRGRRSSCFKNFMRKRPASRNTHQVGSQLHHDAKLILLVL